MLQTTVEMAASISKMLHIIHSKENGQNRKSKKKISQTGKKTHFLFFHVYIINVKNYIQPKW